MAKVPAPTRVLRSQTKTLAPTQHIPTITSSTSRRTHKITKRRPRLDPWYPKRKTNKNPKPRPPPASHFTCRICISHLPRADFIRWAPKKRFYELELDAPRPCIPHLARNPSRPRIDPVCKTCVGAFMAARLDTHGARRVSVGCIEPGCETPWPWELVMAYFPAEKLEEYNLATFEHWRTDTSLFTCVSPSCDFTGLLDLSAPGYPHVECNACAFRACASCCVPWHVDQTCAEVSAAAVTAQMSDPEKETLQLMQSRDGKRCPNCQLVIEKDGGCPCMFCPGCKKSFNWSTAASAVPGRTKALPVVVGQEFWQIPASMVCEADGGKKSTEPETYDAWQLNDATFFLLPDEDHADL
ncbi:hypothetical protein C7974DRAFT_384096 [Boeremia exigua]|uniref:uncharacterized protein n=1 Tax=Boeremia exigua TaxID=749465 RepID=UPI001E8EA35F|nr:uncharacterized protein C7974DRAFT_384096 [Boeremia exigua]KAH6644690.1 hypothetical protein C7974DRAFT_384096 [Boeremia exigua]